MKHCWFITFLAVIALAGCSSEDSLKETPIAETEQPVSFSSILTVYNRTRAAVETIDRIQSQGVGVFAMYTKGDTYSVNTNFTDNFIQNSNLKYNAETNSGSTALTWYYAPLRYWPMGSDEYLSFFAYAPYRDEYTLYSKEEGGMEQNAEGATYLKLDVPSDKSQMTDLLYADASTLANMQYYTTDGGETYVKTGTAFTDDNRVLLTMKHATARIAIDVSSSALADPLGDYYKDKTTFAVTDGIYEYTTKRITLNKVVLLGDDTSGEGSSPKGVFYPAGYLNLGITTDDKPLWVPDESGDKIAITYTNTSSSVETVRGKGNFLLGPSSDWQPFTTTDTNIDAPNIKGNQIVGWRTSVTPNGDGTYSAEGNVTEIGSAADGYLFIVPQDFSNGNSSGNKLYLYVDYTVNDTQQNTSTSIKGYVQLHENFEAGKAYVICIDLGLGGEIVQHTIVNHTEDEASSLFVDP